MYVKMPMEICFKGQYCSLMDKLVSVTDVKIKNIIECICRWNISTGQALNVKEMCIRTRFLYHRLM